LRNAFPPAKREQVYPSAGQFGKEIIQCRRLALSFNQNAARLIFLRNLIEAKVAGKEVVAPPAKEQVHVINLMDALKKSVEKAQKTAAEPIAEEAAPDVKEAGIKKPPRKMAPSKGVKPAQARKRKSS